MRKPCLDCGELSEQSRCPEHTTTHRTESERYRDRPNSRERGYDEAWRRLSRKARSIQTWCSDAHLSPCSGSMTTDHKPEAWQAKAEGKPMTLAIVDVVCVKHNNARGTSRPGSARAS